MKLLHYNIFKGCKEKNNIKRYNLLISWLKDKNYDLISLNEANNWNESPGIKEASEELGLNYYRLFNKEKNDSALGVITKYPIDYTCGIHNFLYHGALHVLINDINVLVLHLHPHDQKIREAESNYIYNYIKNIDEPIIIIGDLNTLSPKDKNYYLKNKIEELISENPKLKKKFLNNDNQINYTPMNIFLNNGFIDLYSELEFKHSCPTNLRKEKSKEFKHRIDYFLGNKYIKKFDPTVNILYDEILDKISDHYPVECIIDI